MIFFFIKNKKGNSFNFYSLLSYIINFSPYFFFISLEKEYG